jgi:hypothetical protein
VAFAWLDSDASAQARAKSWTSGEVSEAIAVAEARPLLVALVDELANAGQT